MTLVPFIRIGSCKCPAAPAWRGAWLALMLLAAGPAQARTAVVCPPEARAPAPEQIQTAMRQARDRGFLWRIRKDGRESFLFGTVHVARLEWMFPGPTVARALQASDTVALELDMSDPDVVRRMAAHMAAPPGQSIPKPLKARLRGLAQAACLAPARIDGLVPEMQIATLSVMIARHDGLDPAYGIDVFLAGYGRGAKKTVVSLETPERQMQAIRMASPAQTLEALEQGIADLEAGRVRPMLLRLAKVWANADRAALSRYEEWCDCMKTERDRLTMKRLLDERNPALADAIAALHASGKSVFAAVGSLHMFGPTALPLLMAERGFTVEAVEFGAAGVAGAASRSRP